MFGVFRGIAFFFGGDFKKGTFFEGGRLETG